VTTYVGLHLALPLTDAVVILFSWDTWFKPRPEHGLSSLAFLLVCTCKCNFKWATTTTHIRLCLPLMIASTDTGTGELSCSGNVVNLVLSAVGRTFCCAIVFAHLMNYVTFGCTAWIFGHIEVIHPAHDPNSSLKNSIRFASPDSADTSGRSSFQSRISWMFSFLRLKAAALNSNNLIRECVVSISYRWQSASCREASFGVSGVELSGSSTRHWASLW
jgi:hypothetical protein